MAPDYQRCNSCKNNKVLNASEFKVHRDGYSKTCLECLKKKKFLASSKKNKENSQDENFEDDADTGTDDIADFFNMSAVNLDAFLASLSACEKVHSISARVDISSIQSWDIREIADRVAKAIWESLRYRFK
jgi:hypothetical protein